MRIMIAGNPDPVTAGHQRAEVIAIGVGQAGGTFAIMRRARSTYSYFAFPLGTLAGDDDVVDYLHDARVWVRLLVFLSSPPPQSLTCSQSHIERKKI